MLKLETESFKLIQITNLEWNYHSIFIIYFQGLHFEKTQLPYHPELVIECQEVDIISSDILGETIYLK